MQNDWMNDESLKNIEPYKLQFLQALVFESSNLKKEQMLPFLMAVMKRGKEKNVSFPKTRSVRSLPFSGNPPLRRNFPRLKK